MLRSIKTIKDVVDWGLCIGCGVCYSACDKGAVLLVNIESVGIRAQFEMSKCGECTECLSICPGYFVDANMETGEIPVSSDDDIEIGKVLEIWEGYAVDTEIRYKGSSGGILSALSLYCLEKENMEFVLHAGMNKERPWLNKTYQSRNRDEILARTGSRYAPVSPCEGLRSIEESNGECVFIGKPCDTAGASMLKRQRPDLDRNLGLVLTFFCAGTPSTQGTLELIKSLDIFQEKINEVRYRGEGWPGSFKVLFGKPKRERTISYKESWGSLNKYGAWRCRLCPDGLGRTADISCGDAWHLNPGNDDSGHSIVLVRTRRGQEILHRAMDAKYLELKPITLREVRSAQANQLMGKKHLFGRLIALKLLLIPRPRFTGFSIYRSWKKVPLLKKVRTILGTLRRVIQRGLWHRKDYFKDIIPE